MLNSRTKWKRQAAVGIELLAEAGNVAAVQSLCRAGGFPWPPPPHSFGPAMAHHHHAAAIAAGLFSSPSTLQQQVKLLENDVECNNV